MGFADLPPEQQHAVARILEIQALRIEIANLNRILGRYATTMAEKREVGVINRNLSELLRGYEKNHPPAGRALDEYFVRRLQCALYELGWGWGDASEGASFIEAIARELNVSVGELKIRDSSDPDREPF